MKRRFRISVVLIIICVLCGCANTHEAGKTNQASVFEADSFSIIAGRPFVIREGAAYCWTEDNKWERYGTAENLHRLYGEDYFIALDLEGAIICEGYSDEEENLPLSAGYASYMRDKMLELNQVYAAEALNMGEDWRVLLKDGRVMVFMLA